MEEYRAPAELLNEKGKLARPGWSAQDDFIYNKEAAGGGLSEWERYFVTGASFALEISYGHTRSGRHCRGAPHRSRNGRAVCLRHRAAFPGDAFDLDFSCGENTPSNLKTTICISCSRITAACAAFSSARSGSRAISPARTTATAFIPPRRLPESSFITGASGASPVFPGISGCTTAIAARRADVSLLRERARRDAARRYVSPRVRQRVRRRACDLPCPLRRRGQRGRKRALL